MVTLNNINDAIERYEDNFRHPNLDRIEQSEIYKLSPLDGEYGWSETYPLGHRCGVYAICCNSEVLYIGKASQQPLSHRLSSYFRYSEDRINFAVNKNHNWSKTPTSIVTWAVPDNSPFEATSLEEYLLSKFVSDLPDNKLG